MKQKIAVFSMILVFAVAAGMLVDQFCPANAQSIGDSRRTAVVRAIESAAPAVVTINVVEIHAHQVFDPMDFWGRFAPRPRYEGRAVESLGSGFIFDKEGHILTNYHVIENADAISSVTLGDGRNLDVQIVGYDPRTDLAVLQAKGAKLPYIPLGDSENLYIGEWSIAIGNPFGNLMQDKHPSVSVGVVSANHRRVSRDVGEGERLYQDMIQTDAAINPGNSGGPLVNAEGQAIGVNTMIFSNSGGSEGLGFAIPINRAKRVAEEIIAHGRRRNPWVGFHGEAVQSLTPYSRRSFNLQADSGVLVTEILPSAPCYKAGLRLGDVITEFEGEPVEHPSDIDFLNWDLFVGDKATLKANRQGKTMEFDFPITEVRQ